MWLNKIPIDEKMNEMCFLKYSCVICHGKKSFFGLGMFVGNIFVMFVFCCLEEIHFLSRKIFSIRHMYIFSNKSF